MRNARVRNAAPEERRNGGEKARWSAISRDKQPRYLGERACSRTVDSLVIRKKIKKKKHRFIGLHRRLIKIPELYSLMRNGNCRRRDPAKVYASKGADSRGKIGTLAPEDNGEKFEESNGGKEEDSNQKRRSIDRSIRARALD